jgi:RNA-dependent RNA polymerase
MGMWIDVQAAPFLTFRSDLYDVIMDPDLLPPTSDRAASYPSPDPLTLDRPSTVTDICDFVVEYINSDVLVCTDGGLKGDVNLNVLTGSSLGSSSGHCR